MPLRSDPPPGTLVRVHLVDGSSVRVSVPPRSTNRDVTRLVAERLDMVDASGFSLFLPRGPVSAASDVHLQGPEQRFLDDDSIFVVPSMDGAAGGGVGGVHGAHPIGIGVNGPAAASAAAAAAAAAVDTVFVLRKRLFDDARGGVVSEDPVENHLVFAQARRDVISGTYRLTAEEVVKAAATQCQADYGPEVKRIYDTEAAEVERRIHEYVPPHMLPLRSPAEWARDIIMAHAKLDRVSPSRAEADYIESLSMLPYFGAALYPAVELGESRDVVLAAHRTGIMVLRAGTLSLLEHITYPRAISWGSPGPSRFAVSFARGAAVIRLEFELVSCPVGYLLDMIRDYAALAAMGKSEHFEEDVENTLAKASASLSLRFGYEFLDGEPTSLDHPHYGLRGEGEKAIVKRKPKSSGSAASEHPQLRAWRIADSRRRGRGVTFSASSTALTSRGHLADELSALAAESERRAMEARSEVFQVKGIFKELSDDMEWMKRYLEDTGKIDPPRSSPSSPPPPGHPPLSPRRSPRGGSPPRSPGRQRGALDYEFGVSGKRDRILDRELDDIERMAARRGGGGGGEWDWGRDMDMRAREGWMRQGRQSPAAALAMGGPLPLPSGAIPALPAPPLRPSSADIPGGPDRGPGGAGGPEWEWGRDKDGDIPINVGGRMMPRASPIPTPGRHLAAGAPVQHPVFIRGGTIPSYGPQSATPLRGADASSSNAKLVNSNNKTEDAGAKSNINMRGAGNNDINNNKDEAVKPSSESTNTHWPQRSAMPPTVGSVDNDDIHNTPFTPIHVGRAAASPSVMRSSNPRAASSDIGTPMGSRTTSVSRIVGPSPSSSGKVLGERDISFSRGASSLKIASTPLSTSKVAW